MTFEIHWLYTSLCFNRKNFKVEGGIFPCQHNVCIYLLWDLFEVFCQNRPAGTLSVSIMFIWNLFSQKVETTGDIFFYSNTVIGIHDDWELLHHRRSKICFVPYSMCASPLCTRVMAWPWAVPTCWQPPQHPSIPPPPAQAPFTSTVPLWPGPRPCQLLEQLLPWCSHSHSLSVFLPWIYQHRDFWGGPSLSPSFHPFLPPLSDRLVRSVHQFSLVISSAPSVPAVSLAACLDNLWCRSKPATPFPHTMGCWDLSALQCGATKNSWPSLPLGSYRYRNFFVIS